MAGTQWFLFKNGTCATNHFESGGFLKSDPGVSHPDIELQFIPVVMREAGKSEMIQHGYQVNCLHDLVSGRETLQDYPSKRVTLQKNKLNLAPNICKVAWDATNEVLEAPFYSASSDKTSGPLLLDNEFPLPRQLFPFQAAVSVTPYVISFQLCVEILQPSSRGFVKLRSSDPLTHPVIQPNYLTRDSDLRLMRTCVRIARHVLSQKAFEPYRGKELRPGLWWKTCNGLFRKDVRVYHILEFLTLPKNCAKTKPLIFGFSILIDMLAFH